MTVPTNLAKWGPYYGNDVNNIFPFYGLIFAASNLVVIKRHTASGALTTLVLGDHADYTVTGVNNINGGNVVTFVNLPTGYEIRIYRRLTIVQLTDLKNQGAFHAQTHEDAFDYSCMIDQQLEEELGRSIQLPMESDLQNISIDPPQSNKHLGWNNAAPWRIENKEFVPSGSVIASNNTPTFISGTSAPGVSTELSRSDHRHGGASFNIMQYGADPTGVADSATAFALARSAALASGFTLPTVYIPNGNYSVSGQLNSNNIQYVGESMYGTNIFQRTSGTAVNGFFRADGTTSLTTIISGTLTKGARTITLPDASAYAIGDLIELKVIEAAVQASDGTQNAHTLLTRIMNKSGNVLTLLDPVPFNIGASDASQVLKVTPTITVIKNLTLNGIFNTGQTPFGNNAIVIFYSQNVILGDINIVNYPKGYGVFLWSSHGSYAYNQYSQNSGDSVSFGSGFGTFDCSSCTFENIKALWPSRDGMTFNRNSYCQFTNLHSVRAQVRNVKFHGCKQCNATNIIGSNSQGGTGLTISGGSSDNSLENIITTGNKGPNASGNQNGVWFNDTHDLNNTLSNVNSWDNGDWDIAIFATDTGNIVNGGKFSAGAKILNQNNTPMFNIVLDDVLTGGLTSVSMVDASSPGVAGPSHRLYKYFPSPPGVGTLMGQSVFAGSDSGGALVEYAKIYSLLQNWNPGAWNATLAVSAFTAGVNNVELNIGNGLIVGTPAGGAKGVGTINAQAVYDDNTLLTCYVLEYAISGKLDSDFWNVFAPSQSKKFDPSLLDAKTYADFWTAYGHLPAMPSREEWIEKGRRSMGDIVQRLWETVELQAVHIKQLLDKLGDK